MRICIIRLNVGDFGKIGTYNVQEVGLAKALINKGHETTVLYTNKSVKKITTDDTYEYVKYLPHRSVGLHGIINVDHLAVFAPEAVIIFSDNQLWAKNVIMWCRKKGIVCVHYFGAVLSNSKFWLNKLYTKMILLRNRRSYKYSINAAKTKEVAAEMALQKIKCNKVINIGLDESVLSPNRNTDTKIREELGFEHGQKVILFIGRMEADKKPSIACEIFNAFHNKYPDSKMIMIGKGILESEVDTKIREYKLENSIQRLRVVPYQEIYKYMVSCDCCINVSHVEIFGMTILESLYYGLPIVAHHAPGPDEIIEDRKSGYLCSTDNPEDWTALMETAIKNRETLSMNEHNRVVNNFVWEKIADEFLSLL